MPGNVGQCGYPRENLPTGRLYAAVGGNLYRNAAACGACLTVENLAGTKSAQVQVIDSSGQQSGIISLDNPSFAMFTVNNDNPQVRIRFSPCVYPGATIKVAFAENGYASPLLFDYATPPTKVEIRAAGGTSWTPLFHETYNYWTPPSMYTTNGAMAALRLTDVAGSIVETGLLAITEPWRDTGKQFPVCVAPPK